MICIPVMKSEGMDKQQFLQLFLHLLFLEPFTPYPQCVHLLSYSPPPLVCFLLLCSAQNTSCIIHFPFHAPILLCWTSILSSLPRVLTYWAVQRRWFARVNALCNLSRKKTREVAASNANTVAVAKITGERGWRVEKKCLCVVFWLTRRSRVCGKMCFGASYRTNKLLLVGRHILTIGLQNCLSSWRCKIRKFTVIDFHCEESTHRK